MSGQYILVVEDEPDLRSIYEMALASSYSIDFIIAESGSKALEIINEKGLPKLIISDYRMPNGDGLFLHNSVKAKNVHVPFVICSADPLNVIKNKFPDIYGHIEKPSIVGPLIDIIDSVIGAQDLKPFFVPIRVSFLLKMKSMRFDLFMKLSEDKFVKVFIDGDLFDSEDAERFFSRKVNYLYIKRSEALEFLKSWDEVLHTHSKGSPKEMKDLFQESSESMERLIYSCGLTDEIVAQAKKCVALSIDIISKNPDLNQILEDRVGSSSHQYRQHLATLTLFNACFCQYMDWTNETIQVKLSLASLFHDIGLDDMYLDNIEEWEERARDPMDNDPDVIKFKAHPSESAMMVFANKNVPAEVDKIILQHHEAPDGRGYPRGLTANWIGPMASLFIIVEDFLNFTRPEEAENLEGKIRDFFHLREGYYGTGSFKKIFDCLRANIKR